MEHQWDVLYRRCAYKSSCGKDEKHLLAYIHINLLLILFRMIVCTSSRLEPNKNSTQ